MISTLRQSARSSNVIVMVTVELSLKATNGKWMSKEIVCLRPHPGDDILVGSEQFEVRAIALQEGESKVLASVVHSSRKRLSPRMLSSMGFLPIDDSE
jgi:hypothetical protein